ncbi:MAG: hypothetical protein ACYCV0_19805, partial [Desulfitobacteriaceae bacterium]
KIIIGGCTGGAGVFTKRSAESTGGLTLAGRIQDGPAEAEKAAHWGLRMYTECICLIDRTLPCFVELNTNKLSHAGLTTE